MPYHTKSTKKTLKLRADAAGLVVDDYSPRDGTTRYRFFKKPLLGSKPDYFSSDGLYTALGLKEAIVWLDGYLTAKNTW